MIHPQLPRSSAQGDARPRCIGILASHIGTNARAVLAAAQSGVIGARVGVVISNNSDALVLRAAALHGVPALHLSRKTHPNLDALDEGMRSTLGDHGIDVVLLAGYFRPVGPRVRSAFPILNLHPSLVPRHFGTGLVGTAVHEAVLAAGDRVTGVSLHLIGRPYEPGPVIAQCEIPVLEGDDLDSLERRVLARENTFVVECMAALASGRLRLPALPPSPPLE